MKIRINAPAPLTLSSCGLLFRIVPMRVGSDSLVMVLQQHSREPLFPLSLPIKEGVSAWKAWRKGFTVAPDEAARSIAEALIESGLAVRIGPVALFRSFLRKRRPLPPARLRPATEPSLEKLAQAR